MAFIVFEGLDGAGKTTLIEALKLELTAQNKTFAVTREPGGTSLGEEVRQLLLRKNGKTPVKLAELFLYKTIPRPATWKNSFPPPFEIRGKWG